MHPPTDLKVAVSGTSVVLSWTPPTPPAEGYNLLAGQSADSLVLVTSAIPAGSSQDVGYLLPRGKTRYVALQSTRNRGSEYSATSDSIRVTIPTREPATLVVDCGVTQVNEGPYWSEGAFHGVYDPGSCVTGTLHGWDMGTALTRIYGATYDIAPSTRVLDLGVVDGRPRDDLQDGPFPHVQFQLSPVGSVTRGSSWTNWANRIGSEPAQVFGGAFHQQYAGFCLDGIATSGSLTVTEVAGLDRSGGGSLWIQGTVTFVDPVTVPDVCMTFNCCLIP